MLATSRSLVQNDSNLRRVIEDDIAQERLNDLPWITRLDILSLDVGIAHPEITIGVEGEDSKFRSRVDVDVPEFLFGLGIHFGSLSASFGTMVYRKETDGELGNAFYLAVNVDLYKTTLNLTGSGNGGS